jgi:phosphoketolase
MHQLEQIKPRLLDHRGVTSGLNFIYVRLNRVINKYNLKMTDVTGHGHGDDTPEVRDRQRPC